MKIAIDATDCFWSRATGTVVYTRELIRHLCRLEGVEITVLGRRMPGLDTSFAPRDAFRLLRSPASRAVWSQVRLPLHLMRGRYDLLHVPSPRIPSACRCPVVVTIHDLSLLKFPDAYQSLQRKRAGLYLRHAVRRATHFIAVSESTKRDLVSLCGIDDRKINVVTLGVDHSQFHAGVKPGKPSAPYVLSVGTLQPRKNYAMLIRAFKRLCERWPEPVELVIAGGRGWMWEPIEAEAKKPPFADRVRLLGYVADIELPSLYAGATLLAMPSLYEGFGIPLLEAMACGVPVIASNVSSIPEVVGDAGVLLDPNDSESWTETMKSLLGDQQKCTHLSQRGFERAQTFTWNHTAEKTLSVYEVVGNQ